MKRVSLIGLLFIWQITGQAQILTREQLTGTWIGVHSEWDLDSFCPLPTYIQLDPDSTYHLGLVDNSATEITSTWAIHGDRVRLDTIHYAPKLITVKNGLLRIGANYPMVFRWFKSIPLDSVSAYQQLSGHVWQSDSLVFYFYKNGQIALENPSTKQRTAHFWRLVTFKESVFLVVQGNQQSRDGNYKPLWQISNLSPKQMQAIGWNGRTTGNETFRLVRDLLPDDLCKPSGFQTCDNCFRKALYAMPPNRSYKRYELNQLLTKQYKPISQLGQSGLLTVQCVVNCQGERGLVELNGFGNDYCPKLFDTRITTQLMAICQNYAATDQSGQSENRPQDKVVSFTFRLKDGHITDILP